MIGLIEFLEEYGESVEADFQRYYGIYLGDLFTGKLSWRRLHVLITCLPNDSQTSLHMHGRASLWDDRSELLAVIAECLMSANYQRGGGKGQKPKPIKRPYEKQESTSPDEENLEKQKQSTRQSNDSKNRTLSQEEFDKVMFGVE